MEVAVEVEWSVGSTVHYTTAASKDDWIYLRRLQSCLKGRHNWAEVADSTMWRCCHADWCKQCLMPLVMIPFWYVCRIMLMKQPLNSRADSLAVPGTYCLHMSTIVKKPFNMDIIDTAESVLGGTGTRVLRSFCRAHVSVVYARSLCRNSGIENRTITSGKQQLLLLDYR
jgi:hypothetical protein